MSPEERKIKIENEMELARRELARKSHDTIRVYNPLDYTFRFMYDRYWHSVGAKNYKDMERFLAIHYFKKICDHMIGQQIMVKGNELKELREKQLGKQFLDKYEENVQIWDRAPKLNDPDLIEQIKQVVIVGLVEEYGMEEPEPEMRVPDAPMDFRPLHEKIFGDVDKRIAMDKISEPVTTPPPAEDIEAILHQQSAQKAKAIEKDKSKLAKDITA